MLTVLPIVKSKSEVQSTKTVFSENHIVVYCKIVDP